MEPGLHHRGVRALVLPRCGVQRLCSSQQRNVPNVQLLLFILRQLFKLRGVWEICDGYERDGRLRLRRRSHVRGFRRRRRWRGRGSSLRDWFRVRLWRCRHHLRWGRHKRKRVQHGLRSRQVLQPSHVREQRRHCRWPCYRRRLWTWVLARQLCRRDTLHRKWWVRHGGAIC